MQHRPAEWLLAQQQEQVREQAQEDEIEAQPLTTTYAVAAAIAAVGLVQLTGLTRSVDAGGLSMQAVAQGEWWRLLTAPMLHGNIIHFWFNFSALISLGGVIELRGQRPWVPVVFLVTALGGAVKLPDDAVNSTGTSGITWQPPQPWPICLERVGANRTGRNRALINAIVERTPTGAERPSLSKGAFGPLEKDLANVGGKDEFFVHLGDIKSGTSRCSSYVW